MNHYNLDYILQFESVYIVAFKISLQILNLDATDIDKEHWPECTRTQII